MRAASHSLAALWAVAAVPFAAGALALRGTVELAEISGSETFLHVRLSESGADFVIHRAGTRPHVPGETIDIFFDPATVFAYFEDGRLAAAPESNV